MQDHLPFLTQNSDDFSMPAIVNSNNNVNKMSNLQNVYLQPVENGTCTFFAETVASPTAIEGIATGSSPPSQITFNAEDGKNHSDTDHSIGIATSPIDTLGGFVSSDCSDVSDVNGDFSSSEPIELKVLSTVSTHSCTCGINLKEVLQRLEKLTEEINIIKMAVTSPVTRGVDVGVNTSTSDSPSQCSSGLSSTLSCLPISTSSGNLESHRQAVSSPSISIPSEISSSYLKSSQLSVSSKTVPNYIVSNCSQVSNTITSDI